MENSHMTVQVEMKDLDVVIATAKVLSTMIKDERIDREIRDEYQDKVDAVLEAFKPHLVD